MGKEIDELLGSVFGTTEASSDLGDTISDDDEVFCFFGEWCIGLINPSSASASRNFSGVTLLAALNILKFGVDSFLVSFGSCGFGVLIDTGACVAVSVACVVNGVGLESKMLVGILLMNTDVVTFVDIVVGAEDTEGICAVDEDIDGIMVLVLMTGDKTAFDKTCCCTDILFIETA